MASTMAVVPTTRKKLQSLNETFMRMQRGQNVQMLMPPPPKTRAERFLIPGALVEDFQELQRVFVAKPSDVYVVSYPKNGTTWAQHIVSLIKNNGVDDGRDLDDKWLWYDLFTPKEVEQFSASCEGNRMFKSHLLYSLMPGLSADSPAKYIYVYRNPKDTAVSYYYHMRAVDKTLSWDAFFERYIKGDLHCGSFLDHHIEWWEHKDDDNVLFMCYEEMKADLNKSIKAIAKFLGYDDLSDEDIVKISEQCTFTAMKQNNAVNKTSAKVFGDQFIRKGIVGDWKSHLTAEQSARIDTLVAEKIAPFGLEYDYGQ